MKTILGSLATIVVLAGSPSLGAGAKQAPSLAGDWIGRLDIAARPAFLRVLVSGTEREGWTADLILQPLDLMSPVPAESRRIAESWRGARLVADGTSWSVVAGTVPDQIRLEVRTTGNASVATVRFRNRTAQTPLHHLAIVDRARERQYAGTYVLPGGEPIHIWRPSVGGPVMGGLGRPDGFLTYLEETTGQSGNLYSVGSDSYVAGPTSVLPDPVRVRVAFREDSNGAWQLSWEQTGSKAIVAPRSPAYRREDVQLKGPGGRLGCDVLMPVSGKVPAVVLVPGAGANDRYAMYMMAEVLAEHGVAALTCDKRGTGTSEGDWRLTSFEQQAQDVAAGVQFLQQRREVDADRVGLFGYSEGAWVAPILAAENSRLGFLILSAVPVTSRRESLRITNAERLRNDGASAAEIARNREFYEHYQQAIIDNDAAAIEQLWRQYAGASWLPAAMPTAETLNDPNWQRARLTWPHEPGPVLRKIRCPVLAIWGAEDEEFLPRVHRPLFEHAMLDARNADATVRVITGANHSFLRVAPSYTEVVGYAPEYFRTILDWLKTKFQK